MTREPEVWIRWNRKNAYSIASLLPLVRAELTTRPRPGIMLYSLATAQAGEVYCEVAGAPARAESVFVAGGPHPSARPEEVLQYFDVVVLGEGEATLPHLIDALAEGRDLETVPGIAFKRGGEVVVTPHREPVDLDLYPPFKNILAPIEISRGCPWGCSYCQTPRLFGCRMRHRSVPVIARFARRLRDIRTTSPNSLAYGSDGRTPRLDRVKGLLRNLSELQKPIYFGTFPSEVRPEFVSEEALELIVQHCANQTLSIGGQSGSKRVLKAIGRGHGVEEVLIACDLCRSHGIVPQVDLIFRLPMEGPKDQHLTLNLAREIVAMGGTVRAHSFMPLPGTPLEHSAPSPLAPEVEAGLGRMALEGRLTGSWRPQR
ncbi:MAG: TIGR04013 family B12-binding domain/radical SAM domain-containing protein [Methanotrichaceae archaeon]|nr:TIGR04013 family B12-binding domain/radical SAM domain-containing protein [Methanotrichaceae archaeon]